MALGPEQQNPDLEIVLRIARRDSEAFTLFYDRHSPAVFGFLCRLLTERAEAEDALQETFWQVWRQAGSYDFSRGSPLAWLIQIARSRGLDRLRQVRLRAKRDAGRIDDLYEQLSAQDKTDEKAMEHDRQQVVQRAMNVLPLEQRKVVTLAFFNGFTHQEIAVRLGEPLGTVKTRIRLGMMKLQKEFQDAGLTG
jgi:RNA polymerase sigma-70 factor (ECF subfamily)